MLISQLFKILGQNLSNFFVGILVETMTPKGHFEINWPLPSHHHSFIRQSYFELSYCETKSLFHDTFFLSFLLYRIQWLIFKVGGDLANFYWSKFNSQRTFNNNVDKNRWVVESPRLFTWPKGRYHVNVHDCPLEWVGGRGQNWAKLVHAVVEWPPRFLTRYSTFY